MGLRYHSHNSLLEDMANEELDANEKKIALEIREKWKDQENQELMRQERDRSAKIQRDRDRERDKEEKAREKELKDRGETEKVKRDEMNGAKNEVGVVKHHKSHTQAELPGRGQSLGFRELPPAETTAEHQASLFRSLQGSTVLQQNVEYLSSVRSTGGGTLAVPANKFSDSPYCCEEFVLDKNATDHEYAICSNCNVAKTAHVVTTKLYREVIVIDDDDDDEDDEFVKPLKKKNKPAVTENSFLVSRTNSFPNDLHDKLDKKSRQSSTYREKAEAVISNAVCTMMPNIENCVRNPPNTLHEREDIQATQAIPVNLAGKSKGACYICGCTVFSTEQRRRRSPGSLEYCHIACQKGEERKRLPSNSVIKLV